MRVLSLSAVILFVVARSAFAADFSLSSPQVKPNARLAEAQVLNDFGCSGANVSPALEWHNAPAGTKSFAITLYDPDAPTGSGWWHWVVFNVPAQTTVLAENAGNVEAHLAVSGSVQSRTDFGKPGYGGACPPTGDKPHRYIFTVYALKVDKLPLAEDAPGAMVGFYIHQNLIAKATLTARYSR